MEHLRSCLYTQGSSHVRDYVSAPVVGDDPFNADTETPTKQDDFISSIENPDLGQWLRWPRYLGRLNAGAWVYHIAVQGLTDMLGVDIHIISTINHVKKLIRTRTSHHTHMGVIHLHFTNFPSNLLKRIFYELFVEKSRI